MTPEHYVCLRNQLRYLEWKLEHASNTTVGSRKFNKHAEFIEALAAAIAEAKVEEQSTNEERHDQTIPRLSA